MNKWLTDLRLLYTLVIPELDIHQLLILVHKFLHHKHLLPTAFANYFTINSAVHLYNTRVRENLHLDSVTTNYGKRTVKYKASKVWNQLPSPLKEFLSVKNFSNKFKKFLQIVDIDNTVRCIIMVTFVFLADLFTFEKFHSISVSVSLSSVCLRILFICYFSNYLGDQLR